jgi:fructose-bisphosphate aldolase/6-deoxy-5-ketofructose 1-phosphate synthase
MPTIQPAEVKIPGNVPRNARELWVENYLRLTRGTGRLSLFAGDQKIEHLNDDFCGQGIPDDDGDPEHLFRIAAASRPGCFASQLGMIAAYGPDYPDVNYLVKLNSKSHLVKTKQRDPVSHLLHDVDDVLDLREASGLNIVAVGYTVYTGSEFEPDMLSEAAHVFHQARLHSLLTVLWNYPRGAGVANETSPHLIAGAAGVALCLGADFVKVSYPKPESGSRPKALTEAVRAAGRTGLIVSGGSSTNVRQFLQDLHEQIHISGACGNATGRNIHQKPLAEAVRMVQAINSITLGDHDVDYALQVFHGEETFELNTGY